MCSHLRSFVSRIARAVVCRGSVSPLRRLPASGLLLAVALFHPSLATGQTQDFDGGGTPYSSFVASFGENQTPPTVTGGGPTGSFLRLATTPARHITTITFDAVAGASDQTVIDFDFRMTSPGARSAAADGLGFAFANADRFPSGPIPSSLPEFGNVEQSIGVGLRTWGGNFVDVNFGSTLLARLDVSSQLDLVSGLFIHAQLTLRASAASADVSLVLTPQGSAPISLVDRLAVPGLRPYRGRLWFGARSGGLSAHHDLDNIQVRYSRPLTAFEQFVKQPGNRLVSYSPTHFDPARLSAGGPLRLTPTASSITEDLIALRSAFNGLILYGSQTDRLDNGEGLATWIVSEASRLGFGAVMLGVWDPKNGAEVDAAAALVTRFGGTSGFAVGVCIGNEGILRLDSGGQVTYDIPDLDAARARLLAAIGSIEVPVVTSEDLARYRAPGHRALLSWGTFLFPIIVPHWNQPGLGPAAAAEWVRQQAVLLADESGRPVLVKEAGWPSGQAGAYTPDTQWQFFAAYTTGPQTVESATLSGVYAAFNTVLEAFDQPWKSAPDFTTWGLLSASRVPKPALSLFLDRPATGERVDGDGDGTSDIVSFRPATSAWWILKSSGNFSTYSANGWGRPGDLPEPGDYDGDGRLDLAVYRPSTGEWWILWSRSNFATYNVYHWGLAGDSPQPADYDGDGRTDLAVFRPANGEWWILKSGSNFAAYSRHGWGLPGDRPVHGDFDGDGKADLAIYRPTTGGWWILRSTTGYTTYGQYGWGLRGDAPVPADYDGDGKTDLAIYRPSTGGWWILWSRTNYNTYGVFGWGLPGDIATPADYDGDRRTDVAIYRPTNGEWWVLTSSSGFTDYRRFAWGLAGDVPL